jgi:hypothetical protein
LPKFYFLKASSDPDIDGFEVVHGQQRLATIWGVFLTVNCSWLSRLPEVSAAIPRRSFPTAPSTPSMTTRLNLLQSRKLTEEEVNEFFQRFQED